MAEEQRTATVTSLATSRFDWERVLRELSLVIPANIWLVDLSGSAAPGVTLEGASEITARQSVAGPALSLKGCAPSQEAVAEFVTALEDIDGVTRVAIASSERLSGSPTQGGGNEDDCRVAEFIYLFEIVAAFDEVPVPPTAQAAPGVPAPTAPGADTTLAQTPVGGGS
jgi:hypothetical protein